MNPISSHRPIVIQSSLVFLAFMAAILVDGYNMLSDSDPLWHLAAGDLIRESGAIPLTDPWSFTAGDYRWLNVAWLWDIGLSLVHEHWGWHGAMMINSIIVALILALTYANCVIRSKSGIASLLAVCLFFVLLTMYLRPLQITHLMIAFWALILGLWARGECRNHWLALLPVSMVLWVNCHGGFILGFLLLAAYGIHTLATRNIQRIAMFSAICLLCLIAIFINPYGTEIIETVRRPLFTVANDYIMEWQAITVTLHNLMTLLFVVLFVILVPGRPSSALPAERWLAYLMLIYALTTIRALPAFAILAAPWLAFRLADYLKEQKAPSPLALAIRSRAQSISNARNALAAALCSCVLATLLLVGKPGQQLFPMEASWPRMAEEIAYLETHHPTGRFINEFVLGGYLAYETRGRIPVFVDPRTETAFPAQVMEDYFRFDDGKQGWEEMLERYDVDGIIVTNGMDKARFHDRFAFRNGWKKAFTGKTATIYVRQRD
ncbi:MAG: hypothetical protein SFW63_06775 [Alphaproteobacteria bacterium]|nr:hypothetical protein [Alphaproteobacteria bacterium]